eukprot:jgi/Galph1/190/GphlegSOOS_G4963.1
MISALTWVPRGVSKNKLNEIEQYTHAVPPEELEDCEVAMVEDEAGSESSASIGEVLASDLKTLSQRDPNLDSNIVDEEELDDLTYRETDALIVCGLTENDMSSLIFYVVEKTEKGPHFYPHHDLMLSSFPLAIEWSEAPALNGEHTGSFVAVGSLIPQIEIYDASAIDELEPVAILGETNMSKFVSQASSRKKKNRIPSNYHTDSVLSLSWNSQYKNYLASGSADYSARCWDVETRKSIQVWNHHRKEVQSICWHEIEPNLLLMGSFDQTVSLVDIRIDGGLPCFQLSVHSDIESVQWIPPSWQDRNNTFKFLATTEEGKMTMLDSRMTSSNQSNESCAVLWSCQAHEKAVSTCTVSTFYRGLVATGSLDETLKLWNIDCQDSPQLVKEWESTGTGAIFASSFCKDEETASWLAVSGSKGKLRLLDILQIGQPLFEKFPQLSKYSDTLKEHQEFFIESSDAEDSSDSSDEVQ